LSETAAPHLEGSDRERIIAFRDGDQSVPARLRGAPFAAGMAPTLHRLDPAAAEIEMRFEAGAEYVAVRDTLQGGAIAAMLDFTMVFLVLALLPDHKLTATANMTISYLRPAAAGAYVGKGSIERAGSTMIFARAELIGPSGAAVATASGVFPVFAARDRGHE
jgi:uncharacterized protein (TIGR00369 family)